MFKTSSCLFCINTVGYVVGGHDAERSAEGFSLLGRHLCSGMIDEKEGSAKNLRGIDEHCESFLLMRCL